MAPKITLARAEIGLRPRLKLFMSADIIGSTAYKQPLNRKEWPAVIQGFYVDLIEGMDRNWQAVQSLLGQLDEARGSDRQDHLLGSKPVFWKTIGDEVVFWKELTHEAQIWLTLASWLRSIDGLRTRWRQVGNEDVKRLDIKATIWIAGFPVRNQAVVNPAPARKTLVMKALGQFYEGGGNGNAQLLVDFIGPGIDIGFRISKFSSSRKMSVSIDAAYLLALSAPYLKKQDDLDADLFFPSGVGIASRRICDKLRIHFRESEELKGVLGGIRYPKFWISNVVRESLDEKIHDAIWDGLHPTLDWDKLKRLCLLYYSDRKNYVAAPFICWTGSETDMPENYEQDVREVVKRTRMFDTGER